MDIVERLREYQESWADSIKRMDCGTFSGNGIMSQIRAEQHDTWKKAADEIETLRRENQKLRAMLSDDKNGTPCAQIRWQQERDELRRERDELRMCIAHLRNELTKTLYCGGRPIDAAQVLNETGEIALKYRCYNPEHELTNAVIQGRAQAAIAKVKP